MKKQLKKVIALLMLLTMGSLNYAFVQCGLEDGYFPHESDCSKYYECFGGMAYEMNCPGGLLFNPNLNVCDWPENAECAGSGSKGKYSLNVTNYTDYQDAFWGDYEIFASPGTTVGTASVYPKSTLVGYILTETKDDSRIELVGTKKYNIIFDAAYSVISYGNWEVQHIKTKQL